MNVLIDIRYCHPEVTEQFVNTPKMDASALTNTVYCWHFVYVSGLFFIFICIFTHLWMTTHFKIYFGIFSSFFFYELVVLSFAFLLFLLLRSVKTLCILIILTIYTVWTVNIFPFLHLYFIMFQAPFTIKHFLKFFWNHVYIVSLCGFGSCFREVFIDIKAIKTIFIDYS